MTITIYNGFTITLTEDQLAEIKRQQNKITKVEDINTVEDACKVLSIMPPPYDQPIDHIQLIIKAVNFLDNNGDVWVENWDNIDQRKHYPVFERRDGGWVVYSRDGYGDCGYGAICGFGSYFKEEKTCLLIAKKFLPLYIKWIEGKN